MVSDFGTIVKKPYLRPIRGIIQGVVTYQIDSARPIYVLMAKKVS